MNDISNDDFVRTGVIVVVADTDIDIRWILIQQIRYARETMTVYQQRTFTHGNDFL